MNIQKVEFLNPVFVPGTLQGHRRTFVASENSEIFLKDGVLHICNRGALECYPLTVVSSFTPLDEVLEEEIIEVEEE